MSELYRTAFDFKAILTFETRTAANACWTLISAEPSTNKFLDARWMYAIWKAWTPSKSCGGHCTLFLST